MCKICLCRYLKTSLIVQTKIVALHTAASDLTRDSLFFQGSSNDFFSKSTGTLTSQVSHIFSTSPCFHITMVRLYAKGPTGNWVIIFFVPRFLKNHDHTMVIRGNGPLGRINMKVV